MYLTEELKHNKNKLREYIGDMSQICYAKEYELKSGKAKGTYAIDVVTGSGFAFTIIPDRGMDVAWISYKGIPFSYLSKTGIVSPAFYESRGDGFLKSFYAGFLTTCGATYMGAPCEDQGEELGMHGMMGNTPAEEVSVISEWINDEFVIKVRGKIRQAKVFGEHIIITREYITKLGDKGFRIVDKVENCGFQAEPLMLLYHFNLGYPLLSNEALLSIPSEQVMPRDEEAQRGITRWGEFDMPTPGFKEQVFYHQIEKENQWPSVRVYNPTLEGGMGISIRYKKEYLNKLIQWKMMGQGEYVLGIEPATATVEGRDVVRQKGELQYIQPGEVKVFELEVEVINSEQFLENKKGI